MAVSAEPLSAAGKRALWTGQAPVGDGKFEAANATITVYPAPGKTDAAAMVICPGGGYGGLVLELEGHRVAQWLSQNGIAGIVLEYRFPKGRPLVPLLDAQRSIRTVRVNAKSWGIDPRRIGILGFSAGGHLAGTAATRFDAGNPKATDPVDRESCRPDFAMLIYPVITMGEKTHEGSKLNLLGPTPAPAMVELFSIEKQVTEKTPPMFLSHATNDNIVATDNSRMMVEALKAKKVAVEYLELPRGDHGFNNHSGAEWQAWQDKSLAWLTTLKNTNQDR